MCLDDQFRSCSLEAYTPLDADDGVANVGIAPDGIRSTNLLYLLDGLDTVVELLTVYTNNLTLFELNLQQRLLLLGCHVLQVGILRKPLCGVEQFATTDAGTPDTYVV